MGGSGTHYVRVTEYYGRYCSSTYTVDSDNGHLYICLLSSVLLAEDP